MQKALVQMNLQLATVISDVAGATGQRIVRAIVGGERNPQALASLRDKRIRASEDEIARSLEGTWRKEHLFALKQALATFDFIATQTLECDVEIKAQMTKLKRSEKPAPLKKIKSRRNNPKFDLHQHLFQLGGVDLTNIDGIDVSTALTVLSETGTDLSRFPTSRHFTRWLGLCPGTKITGERRLSGRTRPGSNRAKQALKMAASSLRKSNSALGAYFRRMAARMDIAKAITAVAHKLARLIYAMLTQGQEYVDQGQQAYDDRQKEQTIHALTRRAKHLGFELVPQKKPENPTKSGVPNQVS